MDTHDTKSLMQMSSWFSLYVLMCQSAGIFVLAMSRWDVDGVGGRNREGEERDDSKGKEFATTITSEGRKEGRVPYGCR